MCEPVTMALLVTGSAIATQQVQARQQKKAGEAAAEDQLTKHWQQQGLNYIQRVVEGSQQARDRFLASQKEAQAMAQVTVAMGSLDGTPKTDAARNVANQVAAAKYATSLQKQVSRLQLRAKKDAAWWTLNETLSAIPTTGVALQASRAVGAVISGLSVYQSLSAQSVTDPITSTSGVTEAVPSTPPVSNIPSGVGANPGGKALPLFLTRGFSPD